MSLATLPILGKAIKNIDLDIEKNGIQKAMVKMIRKSGTKLIIANKSKELKNILKKYPVVVVANHPFEAEVLVLLASLEDRKDVNLIIDSNIANISANIDKYFIPVYIYNREVLRKGLMFKFRFIRKIHQTPVFTKEEEHKKNIENINLASKKIDNGEVVALFPSGGSDNGKWFNGVGYLINGVKNKKRAYVVRVYIEGTSNRDYLRIIPGVSRLLPKFKVTFDEPVNMEDFDGVDAKTATVSLETTYNNWVESLKTKTDEFQPWKMPIKGIYSLRTFLFWFLARLG